MTLAKAFTEGVADWYAKHGNVACNMGNGKRCLIELYQESYPDKSDEQAGKAVERAIRGIRPIISPDSTNKGFGKKNVGDNTSHNPINNKINSAKSNPINNAKTSQALHEATAAAIAKNVDNKEATLSSEDIDVQVNKIMEKYLGHLDLLNDKGLFVHAYVGSYHDENSRHDAMLQESVGASSFRGYGVPNILTEGGETLTNYSALESLVAGKTRKAGLVSCSLAHSGTNSANIDNLEKGIHSRLLGFLPQEQRMFKYAGKGTCRPKSVELGVPYPYYLGILIVRCSLEDAGLRLGTEEDLTKYLKKKKRKEVLEPTAAPAKKKMTQSTLAFPRA